MATQVNEYDCLLLEHVFGQRPDDAHKVKAFVLETIASDPSLQQTELLFLGLFGRACRVMDSGSSAVRPLPPPPHLQVAAPGRMLIRHSHVLGQLLL